MKQEGILRMLDSLSAGQEVAEHETELQKIFVTDNEVYRRLIKDEVDLITGAKGSGKSAMYRMITETAVAEGLHVLTASNPSGAPEFRALFSGEDSEERIRSIWAVYLCSIVGNHVVETYEGAPKTDGDVAEVREILELMGLRRRKVEGLSLLQRIRRSTSVEGNVKGGAAGLEFGAGLKFDLPTEENTRVDSVVLSYPDFFELLKKCADVLLVHQFRLWIAIDRLDECFVRNSASERRAIRALLRTILDCAQALGYSDVIRVKTFMRTDMFTMFTEDRAFTNATHLRRADISWTFNSVADLIAQRLLNSEDFESHYLADVEAPNRTQVAWESLFPRSGRSPSEGGKQRFTTSEQICLWTTDGSRIINPRNVIALINISLDRARENQRRAIRLGKASRTTQPLLNQGEIQAAMGELARRRLGDTVLNEFPSVAPLVEKLAAGPNTYEDRAQLALQLGIDQSDSAAVSEAVSVLLMSGLIGRDAQNSFMVPRLYRPVVRTRRARR